MTFEGWQPVNSNNSMVIALEEGQIGLVPKFYCTSLQMHNGADAR